MWISKCFTLQFVDENELCIQLANDGFLCTRTGTAAEHEEQARLICQDLGERSLCHSLGIKWQMAGGVIMIHFI
jgi:hypothetical protein